MTRTLKLTPAEWEVLQRDGTAWIVRPPAVQYVREVHGEAGPLLPVELVAAAAPCETCGGSRGGVAAASSGYMQGGRVRYAGAGGMSLTPVNCPDCRITLLGKCPECCGSGAIRGGYPDYDALDCSACLDGTVTLGDAYPASEVLPIIGPGLDGYPDGPYIELRIVQPRMDGKHQWDAHAYDYTTGGGRRMRPGSLVCALAPYGDPSTLVGKYALKVRLA